MCGVCVVVFVLWCCYVYVCCVAMCVLFCVGVVCWWLIIFVCCVFVLFVMVRVGVLVLSFVCGVS